MNDIDWDKAPKGYPLWLEFKSAEHRAHSGWYRKVGNYFKGYYGAHWPEYRTGQFFNVHYKSDKHLINDAYLAPLRPSLTWNGEGLPPVGAVVQVVDDGSLVYGHGEKGPVVAHVEDCAVVRMSYGLGCFTAGSLKPIRTPEQIAADEREADIRAIVYDLQDAENLSSLPSIASCLYGKGYRKQADK